MMEGQLDYTDLTVVCTDGEVRWSKYAMNIHFPQIPIEDNQASVSINVTSFMTIIDVSNGCINCDDYATVIAIRWAALLGSLRVAAALVRTFKHGSSSREKMKELLITFRGEPKIIRLLQSLYREQTLRSILAGDVDINTLPISIIESAGSGEDLYKMYTMVKNKSSVVVSAEFAKMFARLGGPGVRKWYSMVIQSMFESKTNARCIACMIDVDRYIE